MNSEALLADFAARDIDLMRKDDALIVRSRDKLTDADRNAIREHKVALLELLDPDRHIATQTAAEDMAQAAIDRIAQLDRKRNELDRKRGRGYDYDPTSPSHDEYIFTKARQLAREAEAAGIDLVDYLNEHAPELLVERCPVCHDTCQWCNTPGVIICSSCYPAGWLAATSSRVTRSSRLPSENIYETHPKELAAKQSRCAHEHREPTIVDGFTCSDCEIYLFRGSQ